jgi:hypothetical protein
MDETPKPLQPFQVRVIEERKDLDDKLTKLNTFIVGDKFMDLPDEERLRLRRQASAMEEYSKILGDRIAAF